MRWLKRFWKQVDKTDSCWIWKAGINSSGYGIFNTTRLKGPQRAHRIAYELVIGPIPPGLYVCHKCDTPACVNPDHLFVGTQQDNLRDAASRGRMRKKLLPDEVRAIQASTERVGVLASRYGVKSSVISKIKAGTLWQFLEPNGA